MITIEDIKKLIAKDETRTLELKKTTGELYKGMETACAFLNSDGGWLMFGIAPSLKIIGQNVTDNTRQEVANAIRKIEPAIDVEVEYIELPDKPDNYVIAIYFDSNNFKNGPYSFDGRAFYKVESTTALMPRQMYEERLRISNPQRFSWENGKIGVCCYIKRAEESVRYTHSVVFILHWISINYGMPYIGFRFKIGACCYTCVKRYQTSIRNRSMLLQS